LAVDYSQLGEMPLALDVCGRTKSAFWPNLVGLWTENLTEETK
jgi:hypothetical protein